MTDVAALIIDLRCLQDENYRERGIGRHALGLLAEARKHSRFAAGHRIVGVTDRVLPALQEEVRSLVDVVQTTAYLNETRGSRFVQLSPMTHDPLFTARLIGRPGCFSASVVYDFIPFDFPSKYLPDSAARLGYNTQLLWLSRYDLFMPISRTTADRLQTLLQIPADEVAVTGAPLNTGFERIAEAVPDARAGHVLVIGGGDWRKNVECPIRAHAGCGAMVEADLPIVVTGRYAPEQVTALHRLHLSSGGRPGQLRMSGHVSEAELLRLYEQSICVVTASRAEGFSLPVVEAMAAAVPSIASRIAAHLELVSDEALLFDPDDAPALSAILSRAMQPEWRQAVVTQQSPVWPQFRTDEVARSFWSAMEAASARAEIGQPVTSTGPSAGSRSRRPRVALLSPMPPERSGVADYTAACCAELGRLVDLSVFTDTIHPTPVANTTILPLSALPMLSPDFDRVVGVMGNSHLHLRIFALLMRYGGACICHDARLLGFYHTLFGPERARALAQRELGRPLQPGELDGWLRDEATLEATFFGDLVDTTEPLMFHSQQSVALVQARFCRQATALPFSILRFWPEDLFLADERRRARERLGIAPGQKLLVTFGAVQTGKGTHECVRALGLLHQWSIPAHLHFAGQLEAGPTSVRDLAEALGLAAYVHFHSDYLNEDTYQDYLLGADGGIQLRRYGMGQLSAALADCIAAGLPTVANSDLADSLASPDYVIRVPDLLSPVLLARALEKLLAQGKQARPTIERIEFIKAHNPVVYAERLCAALGLGEPHL